jgi:hypothetical protein
MSNIIKSAVAFGAVTAALVFSQVSAQAEIHSKSKALVVMEARDLPEQAQMKGNSLFLHSDNEGSTYLYVEQQQGARLSVFDVTDPVHIRVASSTALPAEGTFDFVRPIGDNAELVYFRDGRNVAVLDLRNAKRPVLRTFSTKTDLVEAENLGLSGLLAVSESYTYTPAVAQTYQVVDISAPIPTPLATVSEVKHRVTNNETGTTFLLGNDGLTVIRRMNLENEYRIEQIQMEGN